MALNCGIRSGFKLLSLSEAAICKSGEFFSLLFYSFFSTWLCFQIWPQIRDSWMLGCLSVFILLVLFGLVLLSNSFAELVIIVWKDHGVLMKNVISWLHVIIFSQTSVDDVYEELCILINIGSFICIWVSILISIVNACSWLVMSDCLLLCMFLFFLMIYFCWMRLYTIRKISFLFLKWIPSTSN